MQSIPNEDVFNVLRDGNTYPLVGSLLPNAGHEARNLARCNKLKIGFPSYDEAQDG